MSEAQRLLDQVHSLARLEALETDPAAYATQLAAELPPVFATYHDLEARDAALSGALAAIDTMTARAMRIAMEKALASDTSLAQPTRNVFAHTIVSYVDRVDVLAERARELAVRGGSREPDRVAQAVRSAANRVLGLRDTLRDGVLRLVVQLAVGAVAEADRRARDRNLDDTERKRWSAVRRDLEAIAATPHVIAAAPLVVRLREHADIIDDPEPEPERSFADMIEMD